MTALQFMGTTLVLISMKCVSSNPIESIKKKKKVNLFRKTLKLIQVFRLCCFKAVHRVLLNLLCAFTMHICTYTCK